MTVGRSLVLRLHRAHRRHHHPAVRIGRRATGTATGPPAWKCGSSLSAARSAAIGICPRLKAVRNSRAPGCWTASALHHELARRAPEQQAVGGGRARPVQRPAGAHVGRPARCPAQQAQTGEHVLERLPGGSLRDGRDSRDRTGGQQALDGFLNRRVAPLGVDLLQGVPDVPGRLERPLRASAAAS